MKNPSFAAKLLQAVQTWARLSTGHDVGDELNEVANAAGRMENSEDLPRIVCLCGSTKFREDFIRANYLETMAGNIVLSVGFFSHSPDIVPGETMHATPEQKIGLDRLHKRKIDLADEVLVLNVGGYVGDSTRSEVLHAVATGKPVRWLEPGMVPEDLRSCGSTPAYEGTAEFNAASHDDANKQAEFKRPGFDKAPDASHVNWDSDDTRTKEEVDRDIKEMLARFVGLPGSDRKAPTPPLDPGERIYIFDGDIIDHKAPPFGTVRSCFTLEHGERAGEKAYVIELDDSSIVSRAAGELKVLPLYWAREKDLERLRQAHEHAVEQRAEVLAIGRLLGTLLGAEVRMVEE